VKQMALPFVISRSFVIPAQAGTQAISASA
jgi:hypothetical protein